jgi:hypothetical protein
MGSLSDSEIKSGLDAAMQRTHATLKSKLGTEFQVTAFNVAMQHEVAANNKTVELKHLAKEVRLRRGLFHGATVRFIWNRRNKAETRIVFDSGADFEKHMLYAAFVGALLMAGILVFGTHAISGGRIVFFFVFVIFLIPSLIPYAIFRIVSRIKNRILVEEVASIVKADLSSKP